MVLDKRDTAVIGTTEHVIRQEGCLRNHLSKYEREFVESYFSLDRDNVIFLSANKLIKQCGLIREMFRHVVQKGLLDHISQLDDYLRYLNLAMLDSGIFICRISAVGISDWNEIAISGAENQNMNTSVRENSYSLAEWLGRLVFYGFDIIEYKQDVAQITIAVMKTGLPKAAQLPGRSWMFKMKRVGYQGKMIDVYKLRTMYPFSEFLQDYIVRLNGYNSVGKPNKDFRITPRGRFLRKYWLDELPQLFNLLKGEMALVGVRPLSQTRFNELPEEVQQQRIHFRPGCIPPYVALCMPDARGNIEAELIYMADKKKHPFVTDIRYFFKALFNIFTRRIVSS